MTANSPDHPAAWAQNYHAINVLVMCSAAAGLLMPFYLPFLQRHLPFLPSECASQTWFGRPCPLCGMTRGLGALLRGDLSGAVQWNPLAPPVAVLLALETVWRATLLMPAARRLTTRRIARGDLALHLGLAVAYLGYSVAFALGWT